MDELRKNGKVTRAQLGVTVQGVTSDLAESLGLKDIGGALVGSVTAGIQVGDIIEEANRRPVQSVEDLRAALRKGMDRPVLLLINRQGSGWFVTVRPNSG